MAVDGGDERDEERLAPVLGPGVRITENRRQSLVDDGRRVLVDGRQEERLFVREVCVGERAADRRVAGDVGHRRRPVSLTAEAHDGGPKDRVPCLLALAQCHESPE